MSTTEVNRLRFGLPELAPALPPPPTPAEDGSASRDLSAPRSGAWYTGECRAARGSRSPSALRNRSSTRSWHGEDDEDRVWETPCPATSFDSPGSAPRSWVRARGGRTARHAR